MAAETPVQVFFDDKLVERMDKQLARYGWTRKEFFRRLVLQALPELESATPPLSPANK